MFDNGIMPQHLVTGQGFGHMLTRRGFLGGLLAAPAIVKISAIMPVSVAAIQHRWAYVQLMRSGQLVDIPFLPESPFLGSLDDLVAHAMQFLPPPVALTDHSWNPRIDEKRERMFQEAEAVSLRKETITDNSGVEHHVMFNRGSGLAVYVGKMA